MGLRHAENDKGFTLVELLVYSVLLIVILLIAATLFIRTLEIQRDVTAMADATNTAQLTFAELERDLRNAGWAAVDQEGDLMILDTRIANASDRNAGRCVGYFFNEETGTLHRSVQASTAILNGDRSTVETATAAWPLARDGMKAAGGARAFGDADTIYPRGNAVPISLEAATIDGRKPVVLHKSVTLRPQGSISGGCA